MAEVTASTGPTSAQAIPPVMRTITVRCTTEHAFRVFTERMGTWWPLEAFSRAASEHEDDGVTAETVVIEGHTGGRVTEVMSDGTQASWGEVLVWEPPHRLVLAWKPHPRPTPPTEVEVRFTPEGDATRVDLEHRGWEGLGEAGVQGREEYGQGWPGVLGLFAAEAERETV